MKRLLIGLSILALTACTGLYQDTERSEPSDAGLVKTAGIGGLIIRVTTEEQRTASSKPGATPASGGMITLMFNGLKNNKAVIVRTVFDLAPPAATRDDSPLPDPVKSVYLERSKRIIEVDTKQLPATLTVEGISVQIISVNRQFMTYVVKY